MECFTGSGGRSRLGASRRPFGDGSCYRHSQPSPHNPYGVLAFDEFTDEAKSLRCLSYLTNRVSKGKYKSLKCDYGADEIAPYKTRLATLPR